MGTAVLISVEEYLATSYDPDREYVQGELRERNLGEFDHSDLQTALAVFFRRHQKSLRLRALVEQRVQVKPDRFRVPDVCLIPLDGPKEQIVRRPPVLAIEVLSPDDRIVDIEEKIDDYLAMGIPEIWTIDPTKKRARIYTSTATREARDGILHWRDLAIDLTLLSDE